MKNDLAPALTLDNAVGKPEKYSATHRTHRAKDYKKYPLPRETFFLNLRFRRYMKNLDPDCLSHSICSLFHNHLEHQDTKEVRYTAIGCKERAVCPICGASYWRKKGRQARSLFNAPHDKAVFEGWPFDQWLLGFVFTIPASLSSRIDSFPARDKRFYLNKLIKATYQVLNVLGKDQGGLLVLHFWHSSAPCYPHYHLHVALSPYKSDGSLLLQDPYLPEETLTHIRTIWKKKVEAIFDITFAQELNIHYEYLQENTTNNYEQTRNKFYHWFNYTFRSWTQDLLEHKNKVNRSLFGCAVKRAKELQPFKKIRYFGHLSPVKRKRLGVQVHRFIDELTVCPECKRQVDTQDLLDTLAIVGGSVACLCGHQFKEEEMGTKSKYQRTGKVFILRHFRKNGVIMAEWDKTAKKIVPGTNRLVPYEKIDLFPRQGKYKTYSYRPP